MLAKLKKRWHNARIRFNNKQTIKETP